MKPTSKQLLRRADVPSLLLSNISNIRYLTGIPVEAAVLLVQQKRFVLFTDALEMEMAEKAAGTEIDVRSIRTLDVCMKKVRVCGFEDDSVTVARLRRWKKLFPKTKFVPVQNTVEYFRRTKDERELKIMLRAHSITEELLRRIPSALRVNITERALAWKIEIWARELGADGMSFQTIVAFGKNTSRPHHRPTDAKLKKGDIVQLDLGATYKGYCSDRSEVFFTAEATAQQQRIYDALTEAKNKAIDAIKIGASTRELDRIARDVLKSHKLDTYFTHSLGHGVGIDIHEGVTLSQRGPDDQLLENEVITIEPGVYMPGKFGMRLEVMVVVPGND